MQGSKRERSPGVWELRAYIGRDESGRKRWKSRTVRGPARDADRALRKLIEEVEHLREAGPTPDDPTLAQHLEQWLARRPDDHTAAGLVEHHITPHLGAMRLSTIKLRHVERWAHDLHASGLSAASVHRIHTVLRSALQQAMRWELVDRNAAAGAELPRVEKHEPRVPQTEHVRMAIAAAGDDIHMATLVRLAAATGARRGSLLGLRWSDIDWDTGVITFRRAVAKKPGGIRIKDSKTGTRPQVLVGAGTITQLKAYRRHRLEQAMMCGLGRLGDDTFVFAQDASGGMPWYPDTATAKWNRLAASITVEDPDTGETTRPLYGVHLHDLRHAQGTRLIAAGIDVTTVADRLGHSSKTITLDFYSHPVTAEQRRAAELSESWLDEPVAGDA